MGSGLEHIVLAASRISPLKALSIPRSELQGAVLGARPVRTIRENSSVPISRQYFWADSKTVISSDLRELKPFVGHWVGEILDVSKGTGWKWISMKQNVAGEATRYNIFWECEWSLEHWAILP
ncbi:hypothetical protein JTB14_019959 [Gonioctena quinquepunctata]|nr:hypothetical protein JTB14_019959 [Gonioctena quinquepunctata]